MIILSTTKSNKESGSIKYLPNGCPQLVVNQSFENYLHIEDLAKKNIS